MNNNLHVIGMIEINIYQIYWFIGKHIENLIITTNDYILIYATLESGNLP